MSSNLERDLEAKKALDFGAVARALLRLSAIDASRTRFIALVGEALLAHTEADSVDLCLSDEHHFYCACASRPEPNADPKIAIAWCDGSKPGRCSAALNGEVTCVGPLVSKPAASIDARDIARPERARSSVLSSFAADPSEKGLMLLSSRKEQLFSSESEALFKNLADVVGAALALQARYRRNHLRADESKILHRISRMVANVGSDPETVLERIAEVLPLAFPDPERVAARLIVDGEEYCSRPEFPAAPRVSREIRHEQRGRGVVELAFESDEPKAAADMAAAARLASETARHVTSLLLRTDRAEEQSSHQLRRHSERLATIGTLASNLAHDLNDPLSTVSGFAELLKKEPGLSERGRVDLERITTASRHAQEIVHCLLLLARRSNNDYRLVDLNHVVDESIGLVEHRCTEREVEVVRELDGSLPSILGDPVQLGQVVINLMRNAVHAMPDGGRLTLKTSVSESEVTLAIEDTGIGMSDEVRSHIFDPFFTTKNAADGTGLGLAIVQDIVSLHGGDVGVESSRGVGTRMVVHLPVPSKAEGDGAG